MPFGTTNKLISFTGEYDQFYKSFWKLDIKGFWEKNKHFIAVIKKNAMI